MRLVVVTLPTLRWLRSGRMLLGRPGSLWMQVLLLGLRLWLCCPRALILPLAELLFLILLLLRTLLHRRSLAH
jgi:hypothetical protein